MLGIPCVYSRNGSSINFLGPGKGFFPRSSPAWNPSRPEKFIFMLFFFLMPLHAKFLEEFDWKKGKDPHPQDKSQYLDFTKDPRPLYYKTPPCGYFTTKMSVVRPFSVLSKEKFIGHAKTQTHLKLQNSLPQFHPNCCPTPSLRYLF